ncbi:MAG TPA: type II toxin-antitoxin system VapC family toxin [Hanamia sp.]|nr:type II toxin-antitoxin system VapC family toxin [Hanamia sp.]
MGEKFLIDTNVLIGYVGKTLPGKAQKTLARIIDEEFNISFINKIEVLGHPSADKELREFIDLANMYDVTDAIIEKTIEIRKLHKTKLPDAIIAATALISNLTLTTRNISDFKNIPGLKLMNPWEL